MQPEKKARGRLRQSEVSFLLAYHAIVTHHVVPQAFGVIHNRRRFLSPAPSSSSPITAWRTSTLFASVIFVSEEHGIVLYKSDCLDL